jgi:hypothetical protein
MATSLIKLIQCFLSDRRHSTGGYAEVKPEDMGILSRIMLRLIERKFEVDPDGDLPVEFQLIDRTRYEPMHFEPVPYMHKSKNEKDREDIFSLHMLNLVLSTSAVDRAYRILWLERLREQESPKKPARRREKRA